MASGSKRAQGVVTKTGSVRSPMKVSSSRPGDLLPGPHPVLELADGDEAVHPHLVVVLAPGEVVDHPHVMSATREVQRRRPSQVPVTTEHEDPQPCHLLLPLLRTPDRPSAMSRAGAIRPGHHSGERPFPVPVRTTQDSRSSWESLGTAAKRPVNRRTGRESWPGRIIVCLGPRCLAWRGPPTHLTKGPTRAVTDPRPFAPALSPASRPRRASCP